MAEAATTSLLGCKQTCTCTRMPRNNEKDNVADGVRHEVSNTCVSHYCSCGTQPACGCDCPSTSTAHFLLLLISFTGRPQ